MSGSDLLAPHVRPAVAQPARNYLPRFLLFLCPLAIIFGLPTAVMWMGGEFVSPERVVALQQSERLVLHGTAFTNTVIKEKMLAVALRSPSVLALGTSRVLQVRTGFFTPGTSFYNCGSCIQRVQHLREFLHHLPPGQHPRLLLVGLEKAWFNENSGYFRFTPGWFESEASQEPDLMEIDRANWGATWQQMFRGQLSATRLLSGQGLTARIGLTALIYNQGYRNDGSYLYRDYYHDMSDPRHPDYQFRRGLHLIDSNSIPFERGNQVSAASVKELTSFVDECRQEHIMVIGFLPPYPHLICARLTAERNHYGSWFKVPSVLQPLFTERSFEFYDFSDFTSVGADDTEAVDSFHGSERVYVRLLLKMLTAGSSLSSVMDANSLQADLQRTSRNWDLSPSIYKQ